MKRPPSSRRVFYSTPEVAEMLGISVNKVSLWIRQGEFGVGGVVNLASKLGGRSRIMIRKEALEAFLRSRVVPPNVPVARQSRRVPIDGPRASATMRF